MWPEFLLACVTLVALLEVPGALALAGLGARPAPALALAPLLSVAAYGLVAVALGALGVPASTPLVAAPPLLAALALALARRAAHGRPPVAARRQLAQLGLYLALGAAVTGLVLVSNLRDPDSFVQAWDNVAHFNIVRSMSESGVWSTFSTTYYTGAAAAADPMAGSPHYYPAAWHLLSVMLADALGVSVTCAANVVNAVTCAVVYPAGCWALLSRVFSRRPAVVGWGAPVCLAFTSFPWNLIPRWTLYPNLLSLALTPAVVAAFMRLAAPAASRLARVRAGAVFVAGCLSLALAQPNSVFTAAVFLAPWCAWRVYAWRRSRGASAPRAWAWVAAWAALVAALWLLLLAAPPLRGVVGYYWPPIASRDFAVSGVLDLSFCGSESPLAALRALVAVGVVAALASRGLRWLPVPAAFSCVGFVVAASWLDHPLKHALTGFWYTDPYRLSAMCAIFMVPLAALGLRALALLASRALAAAIGLVSRGRPFALARRAASAVVCSGALLALLAPAALTRLGVADLTRANDLAMVSAQMSERSELSSTTGYSLEKRAFVDRVLELVGPDELVLNMPFDGSVYAYGVSGLNVYWRYLSGYGVSSVTGLAGERSPETPESRELRCGLSRLWTGSRPRAAEALEALDIEYLLVLDRDDESMEAAFGSYDPARWWAINEVDDDTPGFEVVLSDGDMRLYRIDVEAALAEARV